MLPIPVIARSLFSKIKMTMLNDEAISPFQALKQFKGIATSKEFLNRIVQSGLLAMTSVGFAGALALGACNFGYNTK